MVIANGLKRTLALPIIVGGLALATISYGYVATHQPSPVVPSQHQVVEMRPEQNLETIVTVTPVAVAPQIIEKPATLQEIGGIEGITEEYIVRVAKWVGQELGYPMDPKITINFLSEKEYIDQVNKTPNSHIIRNSIGFVSSDGMNVYIKAIVEPYKLVGLVLNETGKAQIGQLQRQKKVVMPSTKYKLEIVEAAAFAYQAAARNLLEESLGFKDYFVPPNYYEENDLAVQLAGIKGVYEEKKSVTDGGYLLLIKASEELDTGRSKKDLFEFLLRQNDAYAEQAIQTLDEKDFLAMAKRIVARKGNPLFGLYFYYDNKLP